MKGTLWGEEQLKEVGMKSEREVVRMRIVFKPWKGHARHTMSS